MKVLLHVPEPLAGEHVLMADMPRTPQIGETIDIDPVEYLMVVTGVRYTLEYAGHGDAEFGGAKVYLAKARMVHA